jgi:N-acetylglucosaminyldiphosphoundecaprenol N-acetyl-beta-D-mannosaminyltransferase
MNVADGAPIAWALRKQGFKTQRRFTGPELFAAVCERANDCGVRVYLYGGTVVTLDLLREKLRSAFPNLEIVGRDSPPFRPLTNAEDAAAIERINSSKAQIVLVSLGCPKQELWMAAHQGHVCAVMVGVGAAFEFYAGVTRRAPKWMQGLGLEWLHRLIKQPRRLWRRYLVTNSLFIVLMAKKLLSGPEESLAHEPVDVEL